VTSVFIVAASPVVRAGLETLVVADERFTVTGSAEDVSALAEISPPDVVLIELSDASAAGPSELRALQEGEGESGAPALVVLAAELEGEWIADALNSGGRAVLPRNSAGGEILAAIEAAAVGLVVVHRNALDALHEATTSAAVPATPSSPGEESAFGTEHLTPREAEVLGMLAEGLGNKEIAWRLKISEHTVKFHVSSIFAKLGTASRTEAVTQGVRRGLIML